MKRKILALLMCTALTVALAGCGTQRDTPGAHISTPETLESCLKPLKEPEKEDADYKLVYQKLVEDLYLFILGDGEFYEAREGEAGILEAVSGKDTEEALASIGYTIQDISGDGVPELLVGAISRQEGASCYGSEIYSIHTCEGNTPVLSLEGRSRSSYYYLGNGAFLYQGSNGAMYSIFGTYSISPDGRSLSCEDYYFTYEKAENPGEIGFYHNTTGQWDASVSGELEIDDDAFWQLAGDLERQIQALELLPFSSLANARANADQVRVHVQWMEDGTGTGGYDKFIADTSGVQVKVLFTAQGVAKDFKVLGLSLLDVDEEGNLSFRTEELYSHGMLTPERPLVVGLALYGAVPYYGVSYVDESSTTRRLVVEMSGEDGSLLLREF